MATAIIGAGIIGLSTAFYLSADPSIEASSIYLVDSSPTFFASASGFAGGFLARSWFPPRSAALGALSFDLHKQLAKEHDGASKWGYSKTNALMLGEVASRGDAWLEDGGSRAGAAPSSNAPANGDRPRWLRREYARGLERIGEGGGAAQVNPLRLCEFLLQACLKRGVQVLQPATPLSVDAGEGDAPFALSVSSESGDRAIQCRRMLLAAGAWTPAVLARLFPASQISLPVSSLAGYSLVLRSPHWAAGDEARSGAHAVYADDETGGYGPEIFARAGGELYIAGVNDPALPLPDLPTERVVDRAGTKRLRATVRRMLAGELADEGEVVGDKVSVVREGVCWRPVTESGVPILDKLGVAGRTLPADCGVWTGVGHGPWGISLSLGTGKVLSEMMLGKETSADVTQLRL